MNQRILPSPVLLPDPTAPPPPVPEPNDMAELWLAARRQAWRVGLAGLCGLALGLTHYATSPREYRAIASILIEERQSDLEQEIAATIPALRSDASILNQVQILRSLGLATEVARQLDLPENSHFQTPPRSLFGQMAADAKAWVKGLLPAPPVPEASAGAGGAGPAEDPALLRSAARLSQLTSFDRMGRSFVIQISHSSHDPGLATAIVNAYADAYLVDGTAANVAASLRTADWMEARIEELRQAALEAAADAEAFRAEFGASDQQGLRERQDRAEALSTLLTTFQARAQEIALSSSFPSSDGRVLSYALVPREPTSPVAWQDLGAGLLLGLLIGLGLAVRREARETGFRTGADVARTLGLPFLGYLPRLPDRKLKRASATPQAAPGPRVAFTAAMRSPDIDMPPLMMRHSAQPRITPDATSPLVAPRRMMIPAYAAGSAADHALRRLHAMTDGARRGPTGHILGVGGLAAGDGATTLAANLAQTAVRAGRSTLLIDGDFAQSGLSRALGAGEASGLVDVLDCILPAGDAVRRIANTGLDALPSGLGPRRGGVIEASYMREFGALLAELANVYDTIIVDLPPIAQFPEAESLIAQIDRFVLAIPWGIQPRAATARVFQEQPGLAARCLGVVLTETEMGRLGLYGAPATGPTAAHAL